MADDDDYRIDGRIEAIGFYTASDPEKILEIQERQKMYERVADRQKKRKNRTFGSALEAAGKKEQDPASGSERPEAD